MRPAPVRWLILFALLSGIYWFTFALWRDLIGPMMADDRAALTRTLLWTVGALGVYVAVATLFFRWLTSHPRD
jgi:type VI protein secretion system component VasK